MQDKLSAEKIAKILEANARYTEALESENSRLKEKVTEYQTREKEAEISPILSRVESVTGELDKDIKNKLAGDKAILDVMDKLAQDQTPDPMGEVSNEKVASDGTHLTPDERFANWATGQSEKY